ncbi:MAG: hypothetical protein JWQ04_2908 [Pedosphaera sp.]|nr:hypothetical protein [Pedosphaera sp.]
MMVIMQNQPSNIKNGGLDAGNDGAEKPAADGQAPGFHGITLRDYQGPVFRDHKSGIVVLHWSRQIGKSFTLAAWAIWRLLTRPGRLVTVLSNSRENGAEFLLKCSEICRLTNTRFATVVSSPEMDFEDYRMELRLRVGSKISRIKVLAANPRTARGFSGDLILDEFAFHENSDAIWAAAEQILSSNPDYLCRIASTGNGRHNLFYRMVADAASNSTFPTSPAPAAEDDTTSDQTPEAAPSSPIRCSMFPSSETGVPNLAPSNPLPNSEPSTPSLHHSNSPAFKLSRITRTMAYSMGVPIYDPQTRQPITPTEARAQALDKRAYDQNYECLFADQNLTLLTHELISAAERDDVGFICEQDWTTDALSLMKAAVGPLYVGFDVGRSSDLSVLTVIEKINSNLLVRAILRLRDMRLPEQELRLGEICRLPRFRRAALDMTGLGLGLFEYAQKSFGHSRIHGINFARTVPVTKTISAEGRPRETVRITEAMAMELLRAYEDRRIEHPRDQTLREDLRKPEKITTPGGRVSIAATRDSAGHADHFWSLALALEAAGKSSGSGGIEVFKLKTNWWTRRRLLI